MKKNTYVAPAITETEIRGTENMLAGSISIGGTSSGTGGAGGAAARGSAAWYAEWDDED